MNDAMQPLYDFWMWIQTEKKLRKNEYSLKNNKHSTYIFDSTFAVLSELKWSATVPSQIPNCVSLLSMSNSTNKEHADVKCPIYSDGMRNEKLPSVYDAVMTCNFNRNWLL